MKALVSGLLTGLIVSFSSSPASASLLTPDLRITPAAQTISLGTPVQVALTISGLGDFVAPSLSTFDLNVEFDPTILGFNSVTFGDPVLGDQLDLLGLGSLSSATPGSGTVNLFELSFDSPDALDSLQSGAFTLATLTFDSLLAGTSPLAMTFVILGDAGGDALTVDLFNGSVEVREAAVPEPATILLLGAGLVSVAWLRRRRREY